METTSLRDERSYEAPKLEMLGTLVELTRLNFPTTNGDFNFFGTEIGATS